MKRYRNLGGRSGVTRYEVRDDAILVEFRDEGTYVYDYERPGRDDVEAMKRLASEGRGLATYINRHVRERYAAKIEASPS